ncbi:MAG: UDP-glucose/GDP-mannose dehydrogenase family protein [Pseudomonadota bacterium]
MRVCIVGTGYVGLVSGVCLAAKGHDVTCVDKIPEKVESINRAESPIHEPGLDELLQSTIGVNFRATTDLDAAVRASDITIIAVGTPYVGDRMDDTYLKSAAEEIAETLKGLDSYHVVTVKSTVVPGTTEETVRPILEAVTGKTAGVDFGVAMNPEFLREGNAIEDFMDPDRIVLGTSDSKSESILRELYSVFDEATVIGTSITTAEMIKYTANSLLATLISFSNEIGNLCAKFAEVDVVDVMQGVHTDKRISPRLADGTRITPGIATYIEAGCGFGGSCFPKDVKALVAHGRAAGEDMQILSSVIDVNERQPAKINDLLAKHFANLNGVPVAVLGLAFKPGTDDMRESPAIPVVNYLESQGASIQAFDPVATAEAKHVFTDHNIHYCESVEEAVEDVEAVVLMTRWPEFGGLPSILARKPNPPLVIDGRRMLERSTVPRYEGIGLMAAS